MKYKPEDMLDQLKTGEDKLAKIKEMKAEFADADYKCRAVRRKLASGHKFYFHIEYVGGEFWTQSRRNEISHLVSHYFPEASVTSSGVGNVTYAEY